MPDQSRAATEHALIQEITAPLATLPDDAVPAVADTHFPVGLRGYDRDAVDEYVRRTSQLVAELQATRSPEAAVRRALQRVGEEVSGILQRAHETAEEITAQSRREADERLQRVEAEAATIRAQTELRVQELEAETERIWAERGRLVADARALSARLLELADVAATFEPFEVSGIVGDPAAAAAFGEEGEAETVGGLAGEETLHRLPEDDALAEDETIVLPRDELARSDDEVPPPEFER